MSAQLAFGTYRIFDGDVEHVHALKDAITSGITLLDTSTNYMDGGAERAIALAMQGLPERVLKEVEIVSKFGYIQGSMMERVKEDESFDDIVKYAEHVYHCIDPEFMRDQLTHSLERLNRDQLDCYLIHNPEYFLLDAINKGVEEEERLDEMHRRLFDVFVALEQEVQKGRIRSYGISSNSFSRAKSDPEFLPYEGLVGLARKAAEYVAVESHHFTTIQLPLNLLEREGLSCAAWAKANGLRVLVNRPLNAQKGSQMYRLADYDEPVDYYTHLNLILELTDNELLQTFHNLLSELDGNRHRFGWIGEYEAFYYKQILPHLRKSLGSLDEEQRDALTRSLDLFFIQYSKMVAYECAKTTRQSLKDELDGCDSLLQECALSFLLRQDVIDYVLVGMRKSRYVQELEGMSQALRD